MRPVFQVYGVGSGVSWFGGGIVLEAALGCTARTCLSSKLGKFLQKERHSNGLSTPVFREPTQ